MMSSVDFDRLRLRWYSILLLTGMLLTVPVGVVGQPDIPLQVYGEGMLKCVAYRPNGRHFVTGGVPPAVLWDVDVGTPIRRFFGHSDLIPSIAVSPNGSLLLTGSYDGTARLWDLNTGRQIRVFPNHDDFFLAVAFSPDGTQVLTGSRDKTAKLWDVQSGAELREFAGHTSPVRSVSFSPDGTQVLTGSADAAKLWDASTGQEVRTFVGHTFLGLTFDVEGVAFSPDGTQVLTWCLDGHLWDANTGEEIRTFVTPDYFSLVSSIAFSPDGSKIVAGGSSYDTSTQDVVGISLLWDVETGKVTDTLRGHKDPVLSVTFSPDGTTVLTGGEDQTARLWNARTGDQMREYGGHTDSVYSAAISPDGTKVLMGYADKTARLWDAEMGHEIRRFAGHTDMVSSVAFSPNENYIVTGSWDQTARLWDVTTTEVICTFSGHVDSISSIAFSPDGEWVLTGSKDKTARLWDVETGRTIQTFAGHAYSLTSVAFSPEGTRIVTGSSFIEYSGLGMYNSYGEIKVWNAATGDEIQTLTGNAGAVSSAVFSPDGRHILAGTYQGATDNQGELILWDLESGEINRTFGIDTYLDAPVAFSPDGTQVLTTSYDQTLKLNLWDTQTGLELRESAEQTFGVSSLAFSPDGRSILIGNSYGTARSWEIDAPRVLIVAGGGDYPGNALAEQTKALAAYAYSICLARGYEKDDIRWLSAFDEEQDVDGDGINDIYGPANKKTLRKSIEWAKSDLISPGRRVLIYMIDHAYLMQDWSEITDLYFGLNPRQTISTTELDSWLDTLTTDDTNIDVTLVVDSCYSGKFVENCTPPEGEKRLVISSTSADREAVMMPPPELTSFSYIFWGAAYMGATMEEAVKAADGFFREFSPSGQRPQMDDNGDGVFNDADGFAMGRDRFGRSWAYAGQGSGEFPAFADIYPSDDEFLTIQPGSSIDLNTTVVSGSDPLEVWAVIRPPAPEIHAGKAVASDRTFKRINLNRSGKTWTGKLKDLAEEGVYIVSYTARFPYERLSRPKITRFRVSENPNPEEVLTIRALLVAGGGQVREFAREMVSYALDVCQKRGYKNDDIRILGRDVPTNSDEFQNALAALSVPESSDKRLRLFIYLVGDCSQEGGFILDENARISAVDLISSLNRTQSQYPLLEIILVVDAPYAGRFIEANSGGFSERRVVIAGTTHQAKGLFVQGLSQMSFSKYFLGNAYQGKDIWTSFDGAYISLVDRMGQPEPLLDDDGDGQTTKDDGLVADDWYIGRRGALAGPGAASLPTLLAVPEFEEPASGDISVWVDVLEAALPERVFVTVVPHSESGAALASFPEIDLARDEETWRWTGTIPADSFAQSGDHALVFYALYADGRLSEPLTTTVIFDSSTRVKDWELF